MVADLVTRAGSRLRRFRAKIGRWVIEYVGDDETVHHLFSRCWSPARAGETPDGYCYHFSSTANNLNAGTIIGSDAANQPSSAICPAIGRVLLHGSGQFSDTIDMCLQLLRQVATRQIQFTETGAVLRPNEAWWVFRAACVEYQTSAGTTRSVALLGGPHSGKTLHAYSLCQSKPGNDLICDDVTCVQIGAGIVIRSEAHLHWPTSLAATYSHLVPFLAMSPSQDRKLAATMNDELREYRDSAELAKATENGLFSEESFDSLASQLAQARGACVLVGPRELFGPERCIEHTQLTDAIHLANEPDSDWIIHAASEEEFVTRSLPDWEVLAQEKLLQRTLHAHAACLDHLLRAGKIPTALANCRLPAAQTQFCLRHYLDGLSDSVRLLTASELDNSPALLQAMQLKTRSLEDATQDSQQTRTTYQGMREVQVVSFSKQGRHVETVAFDPNAEGYAQVKSVWPGQVAEFFSRHSPLRVHELFTETRNSLLLACTRS